MSTTKQTNEDVTSAIWMLTSNPLTVAQISAGLKNKGLVVNDVPRAIRRIRALATRTVIKGRNENGEFTYATVGK